MNNVDVVTGIISDIIGMFDILIVYHMNTDILIINDDTSKRRLHTFNKFGITKFKKLLSELKNIDYIQNSTALEIKIRIV